MQALKYSLKLVSGFDHWKVEFLELQINLTKLKMIFMYHVVRVINFN